MVHKAGVEVTIFFERSGEDARAILEAFRAELLRAEACQEVVLLASAQQADLYLLVAIWANDTLPAAPEGTKLWIFRNAED